MKKIRSLAFFVAALLCSLPACRKHTETPDPLPPATQEGKNTFGCYIDGKPWVAEIDPNILDPSLRKIDAAYDEPGVGLYDVYSLSILASKVTDSLDEYLILGVRPLFKEGRIELTHLDYSSIKMRLDRPIRVYEIDTTFLQILEVTRLDTAHNICAGLFTFTLVSKNKPDTIYITDGRFDIRYQVW